MRRILGLGELALVAIAAAATALTPSASAQQDVGSIDGEILSQLSRVAVVTADFDTSLAFYRDVLGFEELFSGDISRPIVREQMNLPDDAVIHMTVLKQKDALIAEDGFVGSQISLIRISGVDLPRMTRPDDAPMVISEPMLAVRTSDIAAVEAGITKLGLRVMVPTMPSPDGTHKEIVVHDPNGLRVHIVERRS